MGMIRSNGGAWPKDGGRMGSPDRITRSGYISGGHGGGWSNRRGGRDLEFNPFGDDDGTDQENTGINFDTYEDIPVETSGDNVPPPFLKLI
ncbi:hypothetical protein R6Q59_018816 [Mikania micrantha]